MYKNKKLQKLICFIMCFACFFAIGAPVKAEGEIGNVGINKVVSGITDLLLKFGDGVVHIITSAVGETVTIDKVVYNEIDKLSIDYWNDDTTVTELEQEPIKAFMQPVIEKWYKVFFEIATMVYMICLVIIGLKIILTNTADKKANYKDGLVHWVIGLVILFMFPYVMKYTIYLSDALVHIIQAKSFDGETAPDLDGLLPEKDFWEVFLFYGEDEFLMLLGGNEDTDMMYLTRKTAKEANNGDGDITLAAMYLVLIGQMLAILVMYYTRAFMVGFLIVIFPLVAMTYVLDKMGDKKSQTFNTWFKEFMVNVIIQVFHALVYLIITGAGIKSYIATGGQNFLFMVLSVLFLFEGEKILRSIFGINSKAKTLSDLAASGALLFATAKSLKSFGNKNDNIGSSEDKSEAKEAESRVKERKARVKQENAMAAENLDEKVNAGESTESHGEYQGEDKEPDTVSQKVYDSQYARDVLTSKAMKRKLTRGMIRKGADLTTGFVGGTLGATKALATGNPSPNQAIAGFAGGMKMGQTVGKPIGLAASKIEQGYRAHKVGKAIEDGKFDKEIGLSEEAIEGLIEIPKGVDEDDYKKTSAFRDAVKDRLEIEREAAIRFAKGAALGGRKSGDIKFYDYHTKEKKK